MSLKNTADRYGSIAKWLHWSVAGLFLAAYVAVYYRQWFTDKGTDINWTALQMHLSFGVTIGVLVILRVIWRLMNQQPDAAAGTRLEHLAAKIGHYALYAVMIMLPLTGYIGTGVDTEWFFLFDIPKFESTAVFDWLVVQQFGLDFASFEKPIDFIHKEILGKWLAWLLIVGHASAALYHHYVKKDDTLRKMTRGR